MQDSALRATATVGRGVGEMRRRPRCRPERLHDRCDGGCRVWLSVGTGTLIHVETPKRSSAASPESHLTEKENVLILVKGHHTSPRAAYG